MLTQLGTIYSYFSTIQSSQHYREKGSIVELKKMKFKVVKSPVNHPDSKWQHLNLNPGVALLSITVQLHHVLGAIQ